MCMKTRTTTAFACSSTSATRWRTRWKTRGYGVLLHGEAVCIGMVAAAGWGEALGVTPAGTGARIERVLRAYGLPTERDERLTRAHLAAVMALDKKAEGDGVRCVLLTKIGACTGTVIRGAQLEALL